MNIIEIAREAGFKVDWQHAQRYVAFANAVIAARDAELLKDVGEPAHHIMSDGQCIGYYSAEQVAAAVAKAKQARDAELIAGVGKPVAYMYPDDHERMTETETYCNVFSVPCGSATHGLTSVRLYTATQVAGVVAKKEAELKAAHQTKVLLMEDEQVELRKTVARNEKRIAELESTLKVALEALDSKYIIGCNAVIKQIKEVLHAD